MKLFRIVQFIGFVLVSGYLALLHFENENTINIPLFLDMPPALVIGIGILVGFVAGVVPGQLSLWAKRREIRRRDARIRELEQHLPNYRSDDDADPVIPDRGPYSKEAV